MLCRRVCRMMMMTMMMYSVLRGLSTQSRHGRASSSEDQPGPATTTPSCRPMSSPCHPRHCLPPPHCSPPTLSTSHTRKVLHSLVVSDMNCFNTLEQRIKPFCAVGQVKQKRETYVVAVTLFPYSCIQPVRDSHRQSTI